MKPKKETSPRKERSLSCNISHFLQHLKTIRRLKPSTREYYRFYLNGFCKFAGDDFDVTEISPRLVYDFQKLLAEKLKTQSQMNYLKALKTFLKYLAVRKDFVCLNPKNIVIKKAENKIRIKGLKKEIKKPLLPPIPRTPSQRAKQQAWLKRKTIMAKLVREFLEDIEGKRSKRTINNYMADICYFLVYTEIVKPEDINYERVCQWQKHLKERRMKTNTIFNKSCAIRIFLKYLAKRGVKSMVAERVDLPRYSSPIMDFLTDEELQKLLDAPNPNTLGVELRDKAILELMASTGLRVSEVVSLKKRFLNLKEGEATIKGKGGRIRKVFLTETSLAWLKDYIALRPKDGELVFPITTRAVQRCITKYKRRAKIEKKVTPHTLRRYAATHWLKSGLNLFEVKSLLGHNSLASTQRYLFLDDYDLKKAFNRALNNDNQFSFFPSSKPSNKISQKASVQEVGVEAKIRKLENQMDLIIKMLKQSL